MMDGAIGWLLGNPLQGVAALAGLAVLVGLIFVPRLHDIADHGHPRC